MLRYAIHDITRFPRGQDVVSSCRLVQCARASAGKRVGTAGAKSGNAHLQWAFSEAAVVCLRAHPAAQQDLARLEKKHGTGQALTGLAQQLARAVYSMLKRPGAFEREQFFQCSGRGVDEPGASLDTHGMTLQEARDTASYTASLHAKAPRGQEPLRPAPLMGHPLSLLFAAVLVANGLRVRLLTQAWLSLARPMRFATSLQRTVRGHNIIARSQRCTPRALGTCHPGDDGTSRRVWGSHVGLRRHTEIKSAHKTDCRLRQESTGGKS